MGIEELLLLQVLILPLIWLAPPFGRRFGIEAERIQRLLLLFPVAFLVLQFLSLPPPHLSLTHSRMDHHTSPAHSLHTCSLTIALLFFCFVLVFRLLCAEVVLLSGSERECLHTSMPFPQKITHMHTTTCLFFTLDRPNNVIVPVLQTERYCHDLLLRKASHSLFHSLTTTLLLL